MHPIELENEHLRLQIWPAYGSKVSSIVDKADRYEMLFEYPRELPTSPHYDVDYADGWYAGWDECFPGVAKGPYPGHPYDSTLVPDHGELWGIPTQIIPSREGILSIWRGLRFGYNFSRHLRLEGPTLTASYELENLAPFDFHFTWALHSLMAMNVPVQFEMNGNKEWRWSHGAKGEQAQSQFTWPMVEPGADVSRTSDLPAGKGWKIFSAHPIDKPFTIKYPQRGRSLTISYESDSAVAAYWGIWINRGGWAGHKHFAVEPTTGRFDHLDLADKDKSAAIVGPLAKVRWTVQMTVGS